MDAKNIDVSRKSGAYIEVFERYGNPVARMNFFDSDTPRQLDELRTFHAAIGRAIEAMGGPAAQLSFAELRSANRLRLPLFKNKHGEPAHSEPDGSDWSDSDWLQAVVGELGEYANLRKKLQRGDLTPEEALPMLADELADVVIYLDLLAFRLGIDLGAAVVSKFDRVSDRVGCDVKLGKAGDQ